MILEPARKRRPAEDDSFIGIRVGMLLLVALILFGALVLANPGLGSLSIVYLIASWALMIGVLKILFAFKARTLPGRIAEKTALR